MTSTSAPREEAVPASTARTDANAGVPASRPARAPRRAPSDLPFRFADRGLAEVLAAERGDPAWLRAERIAAWKDFEATPIETNQLYTPYIALRSASPEDCRPYITDGPPGLPLVVPEVPVPPPVEVPDPGPAADLHVCTST